MSLFWFDRGDFVLAWAAVCKTTQVGRGRDVLMDA